MSRNYTDIVLKMIDQTKQIRELTINFMSLNPWDQDVYKMEDLIDIKKYGYEIGSKEVIEAAERCIAQRSVDH